jgi:hypothetical protein
MGRHRYRLRVATCRIPFTVDPPREIARAEALVNRRRAIAGALNQYRRDSRGLLARDRDQAPDYLDKLVGIRWFSKIRLRSRAHSFLFVMRVCRS